MIVKVQLSIFTSGERQRVLIYNADRSVIFEDDASKHIIKKMNGSLKKFFHAEVNNTDIVLGSEASWQNW
jgi:hypothetical protein